MSKSIRGGLPVALAALAVAVPSASAAPVIVNLRVEGVNGTIFEGPVTTDEHLVSTAADGNTPRVCNGTSVGSPAGPTATTALDDAAKLGNFTWDGTWDATFNDYFPYSRIGPDTVDPSSHYWSLWRNWRFADFGGCGQRVDQGDEIVWAYEDFTPSPLLRLTGPSAAQTGQGFVVKVVDGQSGTAQAGATVGGANTNADGQATLSFPDAGIYRIKASRADAIRSNTLVVCVDPPGADPCTSSDRTAPTVNVVLPGKRLASETGRSRTMPVSWAADDAQGAGVSHYALDVREVADGVRAAQTEPGPWRPIVERTTLTGAHFRGRSGGAYQFRITAVDRAANRVAVEADPIVLPADDRDRGLWRFSRGWKRVRREAAWGRTVIRANEAGRSATLRFTGRAVSLVGRKLRGGGRVRVSVDGRSKVLRLRGRSAYRTVLWTSSRRRAGAHVLRIRTLGGGPVELDAVAPLP
jgi:hypothetical protein